MELEAGEEGGVSLSYTPSLTQEPVPAERQPVLT